MLMLFIQNFTTPQRPVEREAATELIFWWFGFFIKRGKYTNSIIPPEPRFENTNRKNSGHDAHVNHCSGGYKKHNTSKAFFRVGTLDLVRI